MENYKIRTPSPEISRLVQEKLFELGYRWSSQKKVVSYENDCFGIEIWSNRNFFYRPYSMSNIFNTSVATEISYQDFLNLNTNNNQLKEMDDISLKLAHSPKKAKNITVGSTYTGIYVDAEDTQVDKIEDAEYFLCVNDKGKEARYSIGLFEAPAPVVPPRRLTYEEVVSSLEIDEDLIVSFIDSDGSRETLIELNVDLQQEELSISCGVYQVYNLDSVARDVENQLAPIAQDNTTFAFNPADLKMEIIKLVVKRKINAINVRFVILSTTTAQTQTVEALDSIVVEQGGVSVVGENPNSHNEIKVWTIQV